MADIALLVQNIGALTGQEQALFDRDDVTLGHNVTAVDDGVDPATLPATFDLVVIARDTTLSVGTTGAADVEEAYLELAIPVVSYGTKMKMSSTGTLSASISDDIQSVNDGHELLAGLSGNITHMAGSSTTQRYWTEADIDADVVKLWRPNTSGNAGRISAMCVESGVDVGGFISGARKYANAIRAEHVQLWNASAWALHDAAIDWALTGTSSLSPFFQLQLGVLTRVVGMKVLKDGVLT